MCTIVTFSFVKFVIDYVEEALASLMFLLIGDIGD